MPPPPVLWLLSLSTVLQKHRQGSHRDCCKSFRYPGRQFVCDWTLGLRTVRYTFCLCLILSSNLSRLKAFALMYWAALPILSDSCQPPPCCGLLFLPHHRSPTAQNNLSFIFSGVFQSLSSYQIQPCWHSSCKHGSFPQVSGCVLFLSISGFFFNFYCYSITVVCLFSLSLWYFCF